MMQEFVDAVKNTVRSELNDIHTAVPGKIVSFDAAKGLATVLPIMKFKKPDGTSIDYPQITGVPVLFPQGYGQSATIAFPVKAGDGCLIIIAEKSIDYWLYGQETDTDLSFDMTNAVCIPGLFAKANADVKQACQENAIILNCNGTKAVLKSGQAQITAATVVVNGTLKVNGNITANNISASKVSADTVSADNVSGSADVTGGGISLKSHTHDGDSGGSTSAPNE